MRPEDLGAVCQLLARKWGGGDAAGLKLWHETLEWLYFSPKVPDPAPRAFVIADDRTVAGHVGLTISELRCADLTVRVVHTLNWIVDPDLKVGLLALRLMTTAMAVGDVAMVIGGGSATHRTVPALGFKHMFDIDRRIKILAPVGFLGLATTVEELARRIARVAVYTGRRCLGALTNGVGRRPNRTLGYELVETASKLETSQSGSAAVLRNTVSPAFLNWYRQCPKGQVFLLRCLDDGVTVGHATVLVQSRGRSSSATIVHADVVTQGQDAWEAVLGGVEQFLRRQELTHVIAIGAYGPWKHALEAGGYYKVRNSIPLRLYDPQGKLAGVREWHITAIEGDLAYLLG